MLGARHHEAVCVWAPEAEGVTNLETRHQLARPSAFGSERPSRFSVLGSSARAWVYRCCHRDRLACRVLRLTQANLRVTILSLAMCAVSCSQPLLDDRDRLQGAASGTWPQLFWKKLSPLATVAVCLQLVLEKTMLHGLEFYIRTIFCSPEIAQGSSKPHLAAQRSGDIPTPASGATVTRRMPPHPPTHPPPRPHARTHAHICTSSHPFVSVDPSCRSIASARRISRGALGPVIAKVYMA